MSDLDTEASSSSLSSSVIQRAKGGDESAYAVIVKLYIGLVRGWCELQGLAANDAADVTQEIFTSMWRGMRDFRRDSPNHSFRGWLRTIAGNRITDFWRATQRQVETVPLFRDFPLNDSDADLPTAETRLLFAQAVQFIQSEYSKQDVSIFLRLIVDGVSSRDVAEEFQVRVSAVYVIKSRILKRLRDYFGDLLEGDV